MRVSMFVVRDGIPRLFFVLRRLAIGILLLSISFRKSLLICLLAIRFNMSAPVWTPLHNLLPAIHSEVISVFPQHTSQAING